MSKSIDSRFAAAGPSIVIKGLKSEHVSAEYIAVEKSALIAILKTWLIGCVIFTLPVVLMCVFPRSVDEKDRSTIHRADSVQVRRFKSITAPVHLRVINPMPLK